MLTAVSPFEILIDLAEKAPYSFEGIRARSFVLKDQPIYAPQTRRQFLGVGCGDYSLAGFEGRVGIERKSMKDFQGTLLGWRHEVETGGSGSWTVDVDRRARFKRELKTLAGFECKAVVVEATMGECVFSAPEWGKRTAAENSKYIHSTYLAWIVEFPGVPWIFCNDRRHAEVVTFRLLESYWARARRQRAVRKALFPPFPFTTQQPVGT